MVKLLAGGFKGGLVSYNKRCSDIQEYEDGVKVLFADGTSKDYDAVIGYDGINSRVRKILLGDEQDIDPQFTGKYVYRGLVPTDDAVSAVGEIVKEHTLIVGYGGHLVTFPIDLDHRRTVNVVAFQVTDEWNHGGN